MTYFHKISTTPAFSKSIYISVILISILFMVVRIFNGYGYDNDTYLMLRTWQSININGIYEASRFQGNIVAEFLIGFSAQLGGSYLSNITVFIFSIIGFYFTYLLSKSLKINNPLQIIAILSTNPFVIIASSTSIDYMIGYCFFISGIYFFVTDRKLLALALLTLASGTRLPYFGASIFAVAAWELTSENNLRTKTISTIEFVFILFFLSGLFYLPVWIHNKLDFSWMTAAFPDEQGLFGLIIRFAYKSFYLFGPIGTFFGSIFFLFNFPFRETRRKLKGRKREAILISSIILFHALMFLRAPIEVSYLIQAIPFIGMLIVILDIRYVLKILVAGNILYNFLSIEILDIQRRYQEPCKPVLAVSAEVTFHLKNGALVEEFSNLAEQGTCYQGLLIVPYTQHSTPLPIAVK